MNTYIRMGLLLFDLVEFEVPVGFLNENVWLVLKNMDLKLIREDRIRDIDVGVIIIEMILGRCGEECNISEARSSGSHSKIHLYLIALHIITTCYTWNLVGN